MYTYMWCPEDTGTLENLLTRIWTPWGLSDFGESWLGHIFPGACCAINGFQSGRGIFGTEETHWSQSDTPVVYLGLEWQFFMLRTFWHIHPWCMFQQHWVLAIQLSDECVILPIGSKKNNAFLFCSPDMKSLGKLKVWSISPLQGLRYLLHTHTVSGRLKKNIQLDYILSKYI